MNIHSSDNDDDDDNDFYNNDDDDDDDIPGRGGLHDGGRDLEAAESPESAESQVADPVLLRAHRRGVMTFDDLSTLLLHDDQGVKNICSKLAPDTGNLLPGL